MRSVRLLSTKTWFATRRMSALVTLSTWSSWQKELAPVAVAGLVLGQGVGQALVVGQAAQQVGASARLVHLQLVVGHVGGLQFVDLLVNGVAHLRRRVAGQGNGIEGETGRDICRPG